MKLGTDTGSVVNWIAGNAVKGAPKPEVGMGVTMLSWSDRRAATIIKVEGNVVTVQRDKAKRVDANGMSENQTYAFEADTSGATFQYRQDKDGRWVSVERNAETGRYRKTGSYARVGERDEYYDFSF